MSPRLHAMLPEPTLTFTIPSLHDGTILNCRVYHPFSLSPSPKAPPWKRHSALVAHPYAPLGGNWDDPIVDLVAATLLRAGFMVATFNFRGASGSAGRTSWTTKAERADYMSVAGFLCHYAHFLDPFRPSTAVAAPPVKSRTPLAVPASTPPEPLAQGSSHPRTPDPPPLLVHGGYSFGAMITSQIPSLWTILEPFANPKTGSPAAEIRLRADHLAGVQNTVLGSARRAAEAERCSGGIPSPRKSLGLRVGGDEDLTRKSHESHRSLRRSLDDAEDRLRKSMSDLLAKTKHHQIHRSPSSPLHGRRSTDGRPSVTDGKGDSRGKKHHSQEEEDEGKTHREENAEEPHLPLLPQPPNPRAAYLLVSPPIGMAANLISLSFPLPSLPRRLSRKLSMPTTAAAPSPSAPAAAVGASASSELDDAERKLIEHPTLLMYGDNDMFVSAKKMRDWASKLQSRPGSLFRAHEVSTAGHFWQEGSAEGAVIDTLHHALRTFSESLVRE